MVAFVILYNAADLQSRADGDDWTNECYSKRLAIAKRAIKLAQEYAASSGTGVTDNDDASSSADVRTSPLAYSRGLLGFTFGLSPSFFF